MPATEPEKPRFPKLLTLAQVTEILNVGMPALRFLLSSAELRGAQLGGRRCLVQATGSTPFLPGVRGQWV